MQINSKLLLYFLLNIITIIPFINAAQGPQSPTTTSSAQTQATGASQAQDSTAKTRNVSYYNSVNAPIKLTFYSKNNVGSIVIQPKKSIALPNVPDPLDKLEIENTLTRKKDILKNGPAINPKNNPEINWYSNYHIVSDRLTPWRTFRLQNVAQRQASLLMRLPLKIITSLRGPI